MEFLFFLAMIFLFLPIILFVWMIRMKKRLDFLEKNLTSLMSRAKIEEDPLVSQDMASPETQIISSLQEEVAVSMPQEIPEVQNAIDAKTPFNWEVLFGGKAFVWLGALALAFAGFYLVKYSIEANLVGPRVRLGFGLVFGLSLLVGADVVRKHPTLANGMPISQALSGAGLVTLYSVFYASAKLYALVPLWAAFAGMAGVTALAVILSLRFGMPIALMGLLGGFLTPFIMESDTPNALFLFLYLYALVVAMAYTAYARGWTLLLILTPVGAFIWVMVWRMSLFYAPGDGSILASFLVATALTHMVFMARTRDETLSSLGTMRPGILTKGILIASFAMMAALMDGTAYDDIQWALLWLLCAASIAMAFFDEERFSIVMKVALSIVSLMLMVFVGDDWHVTLISLSFGALFSVSGRFLMSRAKDARFWAALSIGTSLGWFVYAYMRVGNSPLFETVPYLWTWIALGFSLSSLRAVHLLLAHMLHDHSHKDTLVGFFVFSCTAFVALALVSALPLHFLPLALSCLLALLGYVHTRFPLLYTPKIMALLGVGTMLSLLMEVGSFTMDAYLSDHLCQWPSLTLLLPGIFFGVAAWTLPNESPQVRHFLGGAFVFLMTCAAYLIVRKGYHGVLFSGINELTAIKNVLREAPIFLERGILNQIFFAYALVAFWTHNKWGIRGANTTGHIMMVLGVVRIILFDILNDFPLSTSPFQEVGSTPLMNGLFLTYGAPVAWCVGVLYIMGEGLTQAWERFYKITSLILTFIWVSLCVRQFFHGTHLSLLVGSATDAEIYSYSAVWIALGVLYLLVGMVRKDQEIRVASLPVMLLSIGKVFFYDASSLTGLMRAISFLILGMVLLALSWFYSRFVFIKERDLPL